jgi:DNA-binding MarR family transcriptional regulator
MRREETIDHNIKTTWHAIARMYNQQASKYDLTMSMGFVLLNIDSKEGTSATKIAPLMGLEARSLTRLLKTMEESGLIFRKSVASDRRLVKIFLTKEGKQKKEKSKEVVLKFNNTVKQYVSDEKLIVFFEVLKNVNHLIEENKIYK